MKIISYNVNGIRAALNKGLQEWLAEENPDIFMVQELKAQEDQVPLLLFQELGYTCYLCPAQKKGYSGTGIFTKIRPDVVRKGMGIPLYDGEGRLIRADYGDLTVICSYFPSGSSGDERQAVKMNYLNDFTDYVEDLRQTRPHIIIGGDYNICNKPIDINHPERHEQTSGFLPEERAWFDAFLERGYIDTFRMFCGEPRQYTWWSFRGGARPKNLGWRIDYFLATESLRPRIKDAGILSTVVHSDHCPVMVELDTIQ